MSTHDGALYSAEVAAALGYEAHTLAELLG